MSNRIYKQNKVGVFCTEWGSSENRWGIVLGYPEGPENKNGSFASKKGSKEPFLLKSDLVIKNSDQKRLLKA